MTDIPFHNRPRFSIVTAVYNRAKTIGASIDSTLAQSGVNLELVIQDGGSVDGTHEEIAARDDPRIALESCRDKGIYDAINRGIARATGDLIGVMHSDDLFAATDILEKVEEAFANPAIDGVYGDLDYVSSNNTSHVVRRWRAGVYSEAKLKRGWMPPHPALYLRREVFDLWGYYDTSLRIAADYEAILRYLLKGQIRLAYIPGVMVKMRVGGESNRSLSHILRKSQEDYIAIRRHRVGGLGTLAAKNFSKIGQFFPQEGKKQ